MLRAVLTDADFGAGEARLVDNISRRAARGVLLDENNSAAMMFLSSEGFYKLPGGGIEPGEQETDAFVREVLEETGCGCEIIARLGTVEEHNFKTKFCQLSYVFLARKTGEASQPCLTENEKSLGMSLRWISLAEISDVMAKAVLTAHERKKLSIIERDKAIIDYLTEQIEAVEIRV